MKVLPKGGMDRVNMIDSSTEPTLKKWKKWSSMPITKKRTEKRQEALAPLANAKFKLNVKFML